jgi:stage V sporulation protein B
MTEQQAANNQTEIRYIAGRVYQMTLLFSIGTAGIMLFLSRELGEVLYHNSEVATFIAALAPLIPIMYLDTATDSLLKGLGEQVYTMGVNIIDSLLSVVLVIVLLPKFGIVGYIITVYFTELVNATLSITRLLSISGARPNIKNVIIKTTLCVIASSYATKIFSDKLSLYYPSSACSLIIGISATAAIYVLLITLLKGRNKNNKYGVCNCKKVIDKEK